MWTVDGNTLSTPHIPFLVPVILAAGSAVCVRLGFGEQQKDLDTDQISGSFVKTFCELIRDKPDVHPNFQAYSSYVSQFKGSFTQVPEFAAQIRALELKEFVFMHNLVLGEDRPFSVGETCAIVFGLLKEENLKEADYTVDDILSRSFIIEEKDLDSVMDKIKVERYGKIAMESFYGYFMYERKCSLDSRHTSYLAEEFSSISLRVSPNSSTQDLRVLLLEHLLEKQIETGSRDCIDANCKGKTESCSSQFFQLPKVLIIIFEGFDNVSEFGEQTSPLFCPFLMDMGEFMSKGVNHVCSTYQLVSLCMGEEGGKLHTIVRCDTKRTARPPKSWFCMDGCEIGKSDIDEMVEMGVTSTKVVFAAYEVTDGDFHNLLQQKEDTQEYIINQTTVLEKRLEKIQQTKLNNKVTSPSISIVSTDTQEEPEHLTYCNFKFSH